MTKTLTEQLREGTLKEGFYYILFASRFGKDYIAIDMFIQDEKDFMYSSCEDVKEVLARVPSYRELYGANDGNMPTGVFTVLKIIKRDIEQYQKIRHLTDLECGIKSQVVSLLKKWGVK